jgi:hypothetical protein
MPGPVRLCYEEGIGFIIAVGAPRRHGHATPVRLQAKAIGAAPARPR